jgi:hypothetical protein
MWLLEIEDEYLQAFWFIALPAAAIFVVQTIMTFMGSDAFDGTSADFEADFGEVDAPFQLFSLRNLINFCLGFGFAGVSFHPLIENKLLLIIAAFAVGASFVWIFFIFMRQIQKLAEDNSFKFENTVGLFAEVYLRIPGNMSGKGRVMVSVKGATHELEAMTEQSEIPTGAVVKVLRVESGNTLIVSPINN